MLSDREQLELAEIGARLSEAYPGLVRRLTGQRTPRLPVLLLVMGVIGVVVGPMLAGGIAMAWLVGLASVSAVMYGLFRVPAGCAHIRADHQQV
jgi:hypothetical protein